MSRAKAVEWLVRHVGREIFDDDGGHVPAVMLAAHLTGLDSNEVTRLMFVRLDAIERAHRREMAAEEAEEAANMEDAG